MMEYAQPFFDVSPFILISTKDEYSKFKMTMILAYSFLRFSIKFHHGFSYKKAFIFLVYIFCFQ